MVTNIDVNTKKFFLIKSPRDIQQIGLFGRQLNNTQFLKNSYKLATKTLWSVTDRSGSKNIGRLKLMLQYGFNRTSRFLSSPSEGC